MDTVYEIFAAVRTAIDMGVMSNDLLASVVLAIATFVAAQWAKNMVTEADLRRASREMADISVRWRTYCEFMATDPGAYASSNREMSSRRRPRAVTDVDAAVFA